MYRSRFLLFLAAGLLAALATAPVEAREDGAVRGAVTFADSGAPVMGAVVRIPATGASATTDAEGRFEIAGLDAGTYELLVEQGMLVSGRRTVEVASDAPVTADFQIPPTVEERVEVTAEAPGYPRVSAVGTRFPASVLDIPQSIQLIPIDLIEAQSAIHISDVLVNVSGGSTSRGLAATYSPYRIRGQDAALIVNGNRNRFYNLEYDLHQLERVEVLKGPASTYYGVQSAGGLGGVINLVTKRPQSQFGFTGSATVSDRGTRSTWLDTTGPIGDTPFSYRLMANLERSDTFVDHGFIDREGAAAAVRFDDGGRFRFLIEGDLRNRHTPFHVGLPLYGTIEGPEDAHLPRALDIGEPDLPASPFEERNGHRYDNRMATVSLEFDLADRWTLKSLGRYQDRTIVENFAFPLGLEEDNRSLGRLLWIYPEDDRESFAVVDLLGEFDLFGQTHRVLFGVDYGQFRADSEDFIFGSLPPIDVLAPAYGMAPTEVGSIGYTNYYSELDTFAVYANGLFELTDRLGVSLGVRFDDIDQETDCDACDFAEADIEEVSPRVGVTFALSDHVVPFVGWGQAISPQLPNAGVSRYIPETSEQLEAGIKLGFGNVTGTVAFFDLERDGISLNDPLTFLPNFIGAQRTRGVDVDVAAAIQPNWTLLANYAYIANETTADRFTPSNIGNRLPGVPVHSGRVWTSYVFRSGPLPGLTALAGASFASDRAGDVPNNYFVDEHTLLDVGAAYPLNDRIRLQLNFNNILDERYFNPGTGFNEGFVTPGEPRTVLFTVRYRY